ncbi:MAG TPA: TonB-dependent receptor plug domain-containing protein, partial [Anseongella sp.]|nr:TonB-dependent receptor plug domain-containing protein [Anseongella sp.]
RALGYAVTEIEGENLAGTQRENFVNALQGRVAGLTVNNASGLPGSSSSVVIRGVKSLSGSNQPLFIVDGLPINNRTFHTSALASENSSATALYNRSVDFTNRVADINPQDIASVTVLKGPEAAALYGIEAAGGAILITTKKGQAGDGRVSYSNSFRIDKVREYPEIQQVYQQGVSGQPDPTSLRYFGPRYEAGTQLYDNIPAFFETAFTQKHNLAFDGGSEKVTYRISSSYTGQSGVIPNTSLEKLNLGVGARAEVNKVVSADVGLYYTYSSNDQAFRGGGSPLLGLISWPSVDDATNFLNPDGTRRRIVENGGEITVENPYFNVNKNLLASK